MTSSQNDDLGLDDIELAIDKIDGRHTNHFSITLKQPGYRRLL